MSHLPADRGPAGKKRDEVRLTRRELKDVPACTAPLLIRRVSRNLTARKSTIMSCIALCSRAFELHVRAYSRCDEHACSLRSRRYTLPNWPPEQRDSFGMCCGAHCHSDSTGIDLRNAPITCPAHTDTQRNYSHQIEGNRNTRRLTVPQDARVDI
jgi:hypothetical protein